MSTDPGPTPPDDATDPAAPPLIRWTEAGGTRSAHWHAERGTEPPLRVVLADDTTTADAAFRLANADGGVSRPLGWRIFFGCF